MTEGDRLLTVREVAERTRLSRATIYKMVRDGDFPRQVQIGANKVAWLRSEVEAWIQSRADARAAG
ncbi:MAG: AlpA family transcriptional regulator [Pseudomonadota bacterium]